MSLAAVDFELIKSIVFDGSAIVLQPGKEYLATSRLEPVAKEAGLASVTELVSRIRANPASPLKERVVDAMTTNETSFFRDLHPFDSLRTDVLPDLIERRRYRRSLNIWCAACSTGQEPYSIAMTIKEHFPELASWSVRITGTDLSPTVLKQAQSGMFSQLEVNRGVPARMLVKYFQHVGTHWQVDQSLRQLVTFRRQNLVSSWAGLAQMDIVFLRNVLIYFDMDTKRSIIERTRTLLPNHGYLILGGSETALTMDAGFERRVLGKTTWYRTL